MEGGLWLETLARVNQVERERELERMLQQERWMRQEQVVTNRVIVPVRQTAGLALMRAGAWLAGISVGECSACGEPVL